MKEEQTPQLGAMHPRPAGLSKVGDPPFIGLFRFRGHFFRRLDDKNLNARACFSRCKGIAFFQYNSSFPDRLQQKPPLQNFG
jgi:hypothetical protein